MIKHITYLFVFAMAGSLSAWSQNWSEDSLQIRFNETRGLEKARVCYQLASLYCYSDTAKAASYLDQAQAIINRNYDEEIQAYIYKYRSRIAESISEGASMEYLRKAAELFQILNNYHEIGWTCRKMGIFYFHLGNFDKSLSYFVLGQRAFEKENYAPGIAAVENSLGAIDYTMGNKTEAMTHYNRALDFYRKSGDEAMICTVKANLGVIYYDRNDFEKALELFGEAANGFLEGGNYEGLASVYSNIALVYSKQGFSRKAAATLKKAIDYAEKGESHYFLSIALNNIGSVYTDMNRLDSAAYYLEQGRRVSDSLGYKDIYVETLVESARLMDSARNYREAYRYQVKASGIREDLFNQDVSSRIAELSLSHEQEMKEQEFEKAMNQKEIQSILNKIFILLLVVTVAAIVLTRLNLRAKKKANNLLKEKNQQLNEINEQLKNSEEALKKLNASKDRLFSIVAHDLRNPIAAVTGFSELLSSEFDHLDDTTRKEYIAQIIQGVQRTQNLLENLLIWSRSQMKSIRYKPDFVPVCTLLEESIKPLKINLNHKKISVSTDCRGNVDIFVDRDMILTVVRNLLMNAIKFSFPGGTINIRVSNDESNCYIKITDQGIGIQPEIQEKLLDKNSNIHSTPGTSGESGSGLGLAICVEFTETNRGTLSVDSAPGKGSTFTLSLPLYVGTT
ncbi:MAG: tetratricopeptide repeat protein [Bacteroidota bacterium]